MEEVAVILSQLKVNDLCQVLQTVHIGQEQQIPVKTKCKTIENFKSVRLFIYLFHTASTAQIQKKLTNKHLSN